MIWSQSLRGRAIDLVNPTPDEVDFDEIADMMAGVYRWAGSSERDVSIALHTLIGLPLCPDEAKPYWLLHDAPETRIGDMTRPTQHALRQVAAELYPQATANVIVQHAWDALDARHMRAIHVAAGLAPATPKIQRAVKLVDNMTMMIERRDFLVKKPRAWHADLEAIATELRAPKAKWLPKPECAARLAAEFRRWLPVFNPPGAALSA